LVGACAIIEQTRSRLMLCDKIFRVVFKDNSPIAPIFLAEVMRTKHVREQIESKVTGTSPTMKNISKPALLGLSFPLPSSVDDQRMLAQSLRSAREQASGLRKQASEIKKVAWAAFEAAVFSVGQESPATEVALAEVG